MTHSQVKRQSIEATSNAEISRKAPIIITLKDIKKNMSIRNERRESHQRNIIFKKNHMTILKMKISKRNQQQKSLDKGNTGKSELIGQQK